MVQDAEAHAEEDRRRRELIGERNSADGMIYTAEKMLRENGDKVDGEWARWEMEEHVRDEHSTFTWLLEPMFERTGFTIEVAEYSDDGFDARYLLRAASP